MAEAHATNVDAKDVVGHIGTNNADKHSSYHALASALKRSALHLVVPALRHFPTFSGLITNHSQLVTMASTGPEVVYTSSKDMLAHGPMKLHQDIASKVETALGDKFPHMRVRFKHVSLSAELTTLTTKGQPGNNARNELPTLTNEVLKTFRSLFSKANTIRKEILHDVTGSFRPGTITLVVGQSGSGKSALMKLLSGRFPMDKSIVLEGDVLYNGSLRGELLKRLPQFVNYVTQTDTHLPTLTVKEMVAFAHECCGAKLSKCAEAHLTQGSPEENKLAVNAARAMYEHFPGVVLQSLGLVECQNTAVGNEMHRGISGGERRRTSTGEMEFGLKFVTFMDEISTGLDSAAAFDIVAAQRSIAKRLHRTVVISLLQPSPEIFSLFDDVLLLNEGRMLYHGPTGSVRSYFESLGLVCPPAKDIADFLCELATPEQTQYETGRPTQAKYPRSAQEYSQLWIQSPLLQQLEAEAEEQESENPTTTVKFMSEVPEFQQSFASDLWTLIKREAIVIKRNDAFMKGRLTLVAAVGLVFGSLFYQMEMGDTQVAMGVIFAASLFLALGQEANLIVFYHAREVVYKQRAANFYRTSAYVLACSLSQIPLAVVESLLFGSLTYWLGGLVDDVGAFVLFELFLMLVILVFGAVYFLLAVATPNLNIAKPIAMICILSFVLFAGFIIAKDSIPDWLVWLYWLDPVAWTVRSIAVSQYRSSKLDVCVYKGMDYCSQYNMTFGEYSLSLFDVPSDKTWVVYGAVFLVISYVVLMVACYFALEYHRYERPENITLPHETKDEDAMAEAYNLLDSPRLVDGAGSMVVLPMSPLGHKSKVPPVTVAFKDLWYTVSVSGGKGQPARDVDLLKGITGYATPGSLTALMGSTGAGKTTLMDVIAGRKTAGTIKGEILLNGFPATDLSVRRCTGYCEQTDVHSKASTFREALTFSAFLRQGSDVPDCVKYDTVAECLELLALEDVADRIIRGSSMEKMKRLTIGVEMAAQPSVLFLDEPTSGLDARSAKIIMDGVRRVADSGRTVLCTIHQPSSDVFFLFDRLLLLKRGGETVYFGDLGHEGGSIVEYFEAIPSVPRILEGYNPATWMLESIGAGVDSHRQGASSHGDDPSANVDFVEYFNKSVSKAALDNRLNDPGLFLPSLEVGPLTFGDKRAATNATQLRFLLQRFFVTYWRTPSYSLTRFGISLALGLIFGFVYLGAEYETYQGINSGLGMIYLSTMFISMVSFMSGLPMVYEERAAFYRERAGQTYNSFWYFLSFSIVEIPYVFAGALVFMVVYYPMVGFVGFPEAVLYWINLALLILFQAYLTQLAMFSAPSMEVATIFGVLLNSIGLMLTGFNPPALQIPRGYKWVYAIVPHRYSFSVLVAIVFGDCAEDQLAAISIAAATSGGVDGMELTAYPLGCRMVRNAPATVGEIPIKSYVQEIFGVKHEHILQYMGIFVGILLIFRVLAALAMRFMNHQQK